MAAKASFENLKPAMKAQYALSLHECRLFAPVEHPWAQPYRLVEWMAKSDPCVQRRVVPADCTPSQLADLLRSHVPGRRYGPGDAE
jgi:Protein of unknown function (DUF2866)